MTPRIDKQCEGPGATHHAACACREQYVARLEEALSDAAYCLEAAAGRLITIHKLLSNDLKQDAGRARRALEQK